MKGVVAFTCLVASVAAHGYVDNATIGGQLYTLYQPYTDPPLGAQAPQRISRKIINNNPVTNVSLIDLQCGGVTAKGQVGSEPAPLHASVVAGGVVNLKWTLWQVTHLGPVITYMARCPDTGCQNWLPGTEPVFFKIQHDGRHTFNKVYPDDIWATTPFMHALSDGYNYTVPACLKPGYYLVRHEIIALHIAQTVGGAEFYPSCHQLKVSGSGTVTPTKLVSFPGAYNDHDPGVLFDMWKPGNYSIPGPPVFTCPT